MGEFISVRDVARRSSMSEKIIREIIRNDALPHYRRSTSGKIFIRWSDFEAWISSPALDFSQGQPGGGRLCQPGRGTRAFPAAAGGAGRGMPLRHQIADFETTIKQSDSFRFEARAKCRKSRSRVIRGRSWSRRTWAMYSIPKRMHIADSRCLIAHSSRIRWIAG
jgi:hypothetical protein